MFTFLITGLTLGFASAVQPGPLSLYLISKAIRTGWKKTFPAVFVPIITDGPVAVLCLLILGSLPPEFITYVRIIGGFFILWLAWGAFRSWKKDQQETDFTETASSRRTLLDAIVINILNPNAYIGWSLVIGPLFLDAWRNSPATGVSLLACFYGIMFITTTILLIFFDKAREKVPKLQKIMLLLSAVLLAAIAVYQLYRGFTDIF